MTGSGLTPKRTDTEPTYSTHLDRTLSHEECDRTLSDEGLQHRSHSGDSMPPLQGSDNEIMPELCKSDRSDTLEKEGTCAEIEHEKNTKGY